MYTGCRSSHHTSLSILHLHHGPCTHVYCGVSNLIDLFHIFCCLQNLSSNGVCLKCLKLSKPIKKPHKINDSWYNIGWTLTSWIDFQSPYSNLGLYCSGSKNWIMFKTPHRIGMNWYLSYNHSQSTFELANDTAFSVQISGDSNLAANLMAHGVEDADAVFMVVNVLFDHRQPGGILRKTIYVSGRLGSLKNLQPKKDYLILNRYETIK